LEVDFDTIVSTQDVETGVGQRIGDQDSEHDLSLWEYGNCRETSCSGSEGTNTRFFRCRKIEPLE
jgi:hypothetical protein